MCDSETTSEEELEDGNGLAVTVKKTKAIAEMAEVNFMIIINIWIAQEVLGWRSEVLCTKGITQLMSC